MTSTLPDLSRVSLNEIIFEGRNQAYGAFELRRLYDSHLRRATALTMLLCLLAVSAPTALRYWEGPAPVVARPKQPAVDPSIHTFQVPPVEPIKPPTAPAQPHEPVQTKQYVAPTIVANDSPKPAVELLTQEQANATVVGAQTSEGAAGTTAPVTALPEGPAVVEDPDQIFVSIQEMPAYPGGNAELLKYLATHIKYPSLALRNSIEGRVYVKFVVDETGQVVNPVVVKGIGGGCDEEALRVVRMLPRFQPGRQNGRAVKVYFNLPIAFKMLPTY